MKQSLWMLLALCISYTVAAQEEEASIRVLNRVFPSAATVSNTADLPQAVQTGIAEILRTKMGSFADSLQYAHGEALLFKNVIGELKQPDTSWVVPMYDLRYELSDTTLGIQDYVVELRVDQHGRLIYINWPETGFADRSALASPGDVYEYAIRFAKIAKFYSPNFHVRLRYNQTLKRMVWMFQFPVRDLSRTTMLHTIEIDWQKPKMVKEYMDRY